MVLLKFQKLSRSMSEKQILINNLEANFKIAGQGPAVLVLHGWGASSDSWIKFQKALKDKKVVIPDLPGFGKSKTPLTPWSVDDYVSWLENFINLENIRDFVLLGHSFGGRVSIRFAAKHPEKINSLILCSSAGIKTKPDLKTKIIHYGAKIGNAFFTPKFLARFKDRGKNIFYSFLRHKDYIKANETMKKTIKKILDQDLLPDLSKIKTKTLIIWGDNDRMVPVKLASVFNEKIENSKLIILPGIGHSPNLETPDKLANIVSDFI